MSGLEETIGRAGAFVAARGGPLDRMQLAALRGEAPAQPLLEALAARQDASGAIKDEDAREGLPATLRALERLDGLGLLDHPVVEAAVDFLAGRQEADGGFPAEGQVPGGAEASQSAPADTDADEEARIAWTGAATVLLLRTPFARPSLLARAEAWLAARWRIERVQGDGYEAILAFTPALAHSEAEIADEALQWCGRELERGFRTGRLGPLDVARVLLRTRARALPGAGIDAEEVVVGLVTCQAPDGSFPCEREPAVRATLRGIEALLRLGGGAAG